jgi:acetylornithine/succinyldiaminopimelate/putrescine aminotransferase
LHASTFGGNPLVTAAAIAVIEAIEEENMLDNVNEIGDYICGRLEQLKQKYPIIEQVRGKGVMVGIVLCCDGSQIVARCLEKGLRINCTQQRIIRFMPAMNVSKAEIDRAIEILDNVLSDM